MLKVEIIEQENGKQCCYVEIPASAIRTARELESLLEAITQAGLYESITVAMDEYEEYLKLHKKGEQK